MSHTVCAAVVSLFTATFTRALQNTVRLLFLCASSTALPHLGQQLLLYFRGVDVKLLPAFADCEIDLLFKFSVKQQPSEGHA